MDNNSPVSSEDEREIRKRTVSLNKKFPEIEKEQELTEENIWQIVEKLRLTENIDKTKAKELFELLDTGKKGKIKKSTFVEYITKFSQNSAHSDSSFKDFFEIINHELASKSEKIISKLKKLREKATKSGDEESVNDINWIIHEILDSDLNNDLNDLEYNAINKLETQANKTGNIENKLSVEYIGQYSKYWDHSRRNSDLTKVHTIESESHYSSMNMSDIRRGSSMLNSIQSNPSTALKLVGLLNKADSPEFDVFELDLLAQRKTLFLLSNEIFNRYMFLDFIDEDKFKEFIGMITLGYDRKDIHAADVLQTTFYIINSSDIQHKICLQDIDILSLYLSAIIHDYKHPGFTNIYQINAQTKLAVRFNDASVLENYHISQAFKVLSRPECNLLSTFSPEEFRTIRRRIIECVLATDMANHTKHASALKAKIESFEIKNGHNVDKLILPDNFSKNYENQQIVLSNILHASDISNPAKPAKLYDKFVKLLFVEFFNQGDLEKKNNLPVSLLCDRTTTNIEKAQVGFISFIVLPYWEILHHVVPEINPYLDNIKSNLKRYEEMVNNLKKIKESKEEDKQN